MPFPEPNNCPNCGLVQSDRGCVQCIPPEFRAETARAFALAIFNRSDGKIGMTHGSAITEMGTACADELIARLRKPLAGHDPYAAKP